MEFRRNPNGENELLEGDGFFISYNPAPGAGIPMFASDNNSDETALVKPEDPDNEYRILNGDFREGYKKLVPLGFQACLEFYEMAAEKNLGSSWSTSQD